MQILIAEIQFTAHTSADPLLCWQSIKPQYSVSCTSKSVLAMLQHLFEMSYIVTIQTRFC